MTATAPSALAALTARARPTAPAADRARTADLALQPLCSRLTGRWPHAAGNRCGLQATVSRRRSDVEGAARGELAPVVVVVLGWVVVDVGDGHDVLEVGIPADREVHLQSQCALGLPSEAAA